MTSDPISETSKNAYWIIVGPTCSGKSICGRFLQHRGFKWLEASTPMVARVPLDQPLNDRLSAVEAFFTKEGKDFTARWVIDTLRQSTDESSLHVGPVVITGCRFVEEVTLLRRELAANVIALYTPLGIRYDWAVERHRVDVASSMEDFLRHSFWEYSLGLARIFFEADHLIQNNESEMQLYEKLLDIVSTN
jgi:adenylate kinase family enzyme